MGGGERVKRHHQSIINSGTMTPVLVGMVLKGGWGKESKQQPSLVVQAAVPTASCSYLSRNVGSFDRDGEHIGCVSFMPFFSSNPEKKKKHP